MVPKLTLRPTVLYVSQKPEKVTERSSYNGNRATVACVTVEYYAAQ